MNRKLWALAVGLLIVGDFAGVVCAQKGPGDGRADGKVIYGDDDRLDLYQTQNPTLLALADSTIGLFQGFDVSVDTASGKATLNTFSYGGQYQLCKEEPFFDQRSGAFCSGSLVGPDLIMTAGHCVTSQEACEGTKFVFGFSITQAGAQNDTIPASEVYGCKTLVTRQQENEGADYALVKLDRPVTGHKVLKINRAGTIEKGTKIFVIGHPAGLPTKIAGGAAVRDPNPNGYFTANLDTYGGNSGSAVFNAVTGDVEGILVRGEQDYVWKGECRVSNRCPNDGCRGEDVTKIGSLSQFIPAPSKNLGHFEAKAPVVHRAQAFGDLQRWSDRAK